MKFTVDKTSLLIAAQRAKRITPAGKAVVSSPYALLQAKDGYVSVFATDLTQFLVSRVPSVVIEPGELGVIPSQFVDMVSKMPDGRLRIESFEGRLAISAEGSRRQFKLGYMSSEDIPTHHGCSRGTPVKVSGALLAEHIKRVFPAAYDGEDRPNMAGVAFDRRAGGLALAATNGHCLSTVDIDVDLGEGDVVILHGSAAKTVASELASVESVGLLVDERGFSFVSELTEMFVPMLAEETKFPPYRRILEMVKRETTATVRVSDLTGAAVAMSTASETVTLRIGEGIELVSARDLKSAEDHVSATVEGPHGEVTLNTRYLLDALRGSPTPEVTIHIAAPLDPVLIATPIYSSVIMPIRK